MLIEVFFFLINFRYGKLYGFTDISLVELHPWDELWKRFSIWQEYRGFGLELGQEAGYVVPLGFFATLSALGLGAVQINFINNLVLFVLPGLSIYALAYSIFYRHPEREEISFFAGLLAGTSFHRYIRGTHPLFLETWSSGMVPLIISDMLLLLQTGRKRFWLVLVALCYLNLGSFIGIPFALVGFAFAGWYIAYYVLFESQNRRQDLKRILLAGVVFVMISLPLIVAQVHLFFSQFWKSSFLESYTKSVLALNLENRDYSQLLYGVRLIGTVNWNAAVEWTGKLYYPYYTLFTENPVFIFSSFLLPGLAFGSLLFKDLHILRRRLLFLAMTSIVLLFLLKGVREPFGSIFLWFMTNLPLFAVFRTQYDKVAPALVYTLSAAAAYTLSRILPSLRDRSSLLKRALVVVVLVALVVNSYPAYSGQVLFPEGFNNVPAYYQDLAQYVKSDPSWYKILGLPEIEYTNLYTWNNGTGYFGVAFDGTNLNKPVLHRSYMGSDIYDERMLKAIHDEVRFASGLPPPFRPFSDTSIFPDWRDPSATINPDRVRYFAYLLQKSNVGMMLLRKDMAGAGAYQFNEVDWSRYNDLFGSLSSLGLIKFERQFGNVIIYRVESAVPLIYVSSLANVYATNDYDTMFLESRYANSRLALLASLFAYNISRDYVAAHGSVSIGDVYVPFLTAQYLEKVRNDLAAEETALKPDRERIAQLNETVKELTKIGSLDPDSAQYSDFIRKTGVFDIFLRMDDRLMDAVIGKPLVFGDKEMVVTDLQRVGNGWFKVGKVFLSAGRLLIGTKFPLRVVLFDPAKREAELRTPIVVQGAVIRRLENGGWEIVFQDFGIYRYMSLGQLLADQRLDFDFRIEITRALDLKSVIRGAIDIVLSAAAERQRSAIPTVTFSRVYPGKFLVGIEHAAGPFFLNFLESYHKDWKVYFTAGDTSMGRIVRDYGRSIELEHGRTFVDFYDLDALRAAPILDDNHFVLNGFSNSWYVDINDLANRRIITQDADGTYSFSLVLYFAPEAYFVLATVASAITGLFVFVVLCYPTIRAWTHWKRRSEK